MKKRSITELFVTIGILILIGLLGSWTFAKFDLTQEKRHTLTEATIEMLEGLEDDFYIKCYLHGEFPAKFKRLEKAIKERLDEFDDYSGGKVSYEFIDPYDSENEKDHKEMEKWLYDQGLDFTRLTYMENGVKKFSNIWPGVIINYNGKDMPVMLFKSNLPEPTDEMVNTSINNLEYELTGAMRIMQRKKRHTIAVIEGHGELKDVELNRFIAGLRESYDVERLELGGRVDALSVKPEATKYRVNNHDLVIIAKPTEEWSFQDKILLDQYIMNGGKVLWMIDPMEVNLDSLRINQFTMGISNETGLHDQLFNYGVRLNRDIVLDYNCAPIAMDAGPMANQRNIQMYNWYFAPLIKERNGSHPISSNLDEIFFEFTSSMDLVGEDPEIKKTVLLSSGELSKAFPAPVRVSPDVVSLEQSYFANNSEPNKAVAVLLEGNFKSAFTNRIGGDVKNDPAFAFRERSDHNKMIVISDGDVCKNSYEPDGNGGFLTYPLGYNKYFKTVMYDNGEFLMNAVNYLLDDQALISIRSRNIELRKLNTPVIIGNKLKYQIINVVFPLIIIVGIGLLVNFLRKRKYSRI